MINEENLKAQFDRMSLMVKTKLIEVYYPTGESIAPDGTIKSNAEIAKEILDAAQSSGQVVIPIVKKEG